MICLRRRLLGQKASLNWTLTSLGKCRCFQQRAETYQLGPAIKSEQCRPPNVRAMHLSCIPSYLQVVTSRRTAFDNASRIYVTRIQHRKRRRKDHLSITHRSVRSMSGLWRCVGKIEDWKISMSSLKLSVQRFLERLLHQLAASSSALPMLCPLLVFASMKAPK